jgi:hypothetical protein
VLTALACSPPFLMRAAVAGISIPVDVDEEA